MKMVLFFQLILYLLLGYLLCALFMYLRQDAFIFYPTSAHHQDHGFDKVEAYRLDLAAVSLQGWLVNPEFAREKLLIYYGGNAEDIFLNIDEYRDIQASSLFVAYRGYGASGGSPGEVELFADSLAVIDDMVERYSPSRIYLIGRSLGSGVACYAAARRKVQGTILITPYDSIENVARSAYPWLPVSLLLKHRFNSVEQMEYINSPLLIIYGGQDQVVRPDRTKSLIRHIRGDKQIVFIEQADHGTIDMFSEYWQAILTFINQEKTEGE